jgi:hypothetical protein
MNVERSGWITFLKLSDLYRTVVQRLATEIDFIEVIGGGSRFSFVREARETLNAEEAAPGR